MTENPQISPITEVDGDPLKDLVDGKQAEIDIYSSNRFEILWENLAYAGLVEPAIRIGTLVSLVVLVLIVVWLLRLIYFVNPEISSSHGDNAFLGVAPPTATPTMASQFYPSILRQNQPT